MRGPDGVERLVAPVVLKVAMKDALLKSMW